MNNPDQQVSANPEVENQQEHSNQNLSTSESLHSPLDETQLDEHFNKEITKEMSEQFGKQTEKSPEHGKISENISEGISEGISENIQNPMSPTITMESTISSGQNIHHLHQSIGKEDFAEDGLDQEIQRAIAQHDLEQQQLHIPDQAHETLQSHNLETQNLSSNQDIDRHLEVDQQLKQIDQEINQMAQMDGMGRMSQIGPIDRNRMTLVDEKLHLQMIADELKRATSSEPMKDGYSDHASPVHDPKRSSTHISKPGQSVPTIGLASGPKPSDGGQSREATHIPEGSELLAANTALAAYNALSSNIPPLGLLASAHLAALPMSIVVPDYLPARIQLLMTSLPVLDNLATQLLRTFVVGPYQRIIDLASNPETPQGAAFRDLTSLFEFTKRLYSEEEPFLSVEHIAPGMWKEGERTLNIFRSREQTIESTLRKVNLATFLAATLGTIEVGFFHLNESFLSVFCPLNNLDPSNSMSNMSVSNMNLQSGVNTIIGDKVGKVLKSQAVLYLDLKTQAYISAVEAGERSSQEILEDILPSNLEEILLERRGVKTLSPTEMDFINRCKSRKEILLNYPEAESLSEEYEWFAFLNDLFDFVSKNMTFLIWGKKSKASASRSSDRTPSSNPHGSTNTPHSDETLHAIQDSLSVSGSLSGEDRRPVVDPSNYEDLNEITSVLLPSEIQEQQIHLRMNPRISNKISNRRPWTKEEEKALRHALEMKGPLWSTILELFGQGGRINELLKNRTQVQLKDKARNWKMFFLKSGLAVPAYLQKVTGDIERDDKVRAKNARNKKTAAAPVPVVSKRDEPLEEEEKNKRRKFDTTE